MSKTESLKASIEHLELARLALCRHFRCEACPGFSYSARSCRFNVVKQYVAKELEEENAN